MTGCGPERDGAFAPTAGPARAATWARRALAPLTVALWLALPAHGQEALRLGLPLQCIPGQDCWISNHVDHDPGPEAKDYNCGQFTYDAHNGVDFAVRDLVAMAEGMKVVAAAAGTVLRVRDGVADRNVRQSGGPDSVKGQECGNGAVIGHGDGWETQYCHMRRGSISVKAGQRVAAGASIGLVGMSGLTEYPHLHMTVRHRGQVVDPFRGVAGGGTCGPGQQPLWLPKAMASLPYVPGTIYNAGFAGTRPTPEGVREGRFRGRTIPGNAEIFVLWAELFAVAPGDHVRFKILDPEGRTFLDQTVDIDRRRARLFQFVGRNRRAESWPIGTYRGEIRLTRGEGGGAEFSARKITIEVR